MIRLATTADAERVAAIYAPGVERTFASFEEVAPDAAEMARRIEVTLPAYPWLVCEADGQVVGYAYAGPHHARAGYRWSVNASVYIDDRAHRRGFGRALYTSLFAILRAQGYLNVYAGIAIPNAGSVGLHESLGFVPVAVYPGVGYKRGAWVDVGWWHLLLAPLSDNPVAPVPLAEVQARPDWPALLGAGDHPRSHPSANRQTTLPPRRTGRS